MIESPQRSARVRSTGKRLRMHSRSTKNDFVLPARRVGERHCLGCRGGFVKQRGVGDIEAGEVADQVWKLNKASSRPWLSLAGTGV